MSKQIAENYLKNLTNTISDLDIDAICKVSEIVNAAVDNDKTNLCMWKWWKCCK